MPELPEVETIVRGLRPHLVGRTVEGVEVLWPGAVLPLTPSELADRLIGRRFTGLSRRAKYIVADTDGDDSLLVHLGMSGRLFFRASGEPDDSHVRVRLQLDGAAELRFADARKFGHARLLPTGAVALLLSRLGPEPLTESFGVPELRTALADRRAPLKALLLDQRLMAGLGNIYADEALHLAGLHPLRKPVDLREEDWPRLHRAIRAALAEGIEHRGTTFDSYRDEHGRSGNHQNSLRVYRRTGLPCPQCNQPIERLVIGGRSSHFCPRCQQ